MTTIDVCLDIEAHENPTVLGLQNLGEIIERGIMLLRIDSGVTDDQPVYVHLKSLIAQIDSALLTKPADIGGKKVCLNIGAFVYDLSYTVSIPTNLLGELMAYFPQLVVEIAYYRCDPENSDKQ